jgi:polyadenylate-binding protein 2
VCCAGSTPAITRPCAAAQVMQKRTNLPGLRAGRGRGRGRGPPGGYGGYSPYGGYGGRAGGGYGYAPTYGGRGRGGYGGPG